MFAAMHLLVFLLSLVLCLTGFVSSDDLVALAVVPAVVIYQEAKPTWVRLAKLRKRWDVSRTTLFNIQRRYPELASEYPFGPGLPYVRVSAVEAFEQRRHGIDEEAQTAERVTGTGQAPCSAQSVSA